MENRINKMLLSKELFNVKNIDMENKENEVPINHMNERPNKKFTKQDKVLKETSHSLNVKEELDCRMLNKIKDLQKIQIKDEKRILEDLNKVFNSFDEMNKQSKETQHKVKEIDLEKINSDNSQKIRQQEKKDMRETFDDNVKQMKIILQKDNENNIKLDKKEDIITLNVFKEGLSKKQKDEKRKYKNQDLVEVIKMLNDTIDKGEALLKQKNYSPDLEKNMKKIRQFVNLFQKYYKHDADEKCLTKYDNISAHKSRLTEKVSEMEHKLQKIKLYNTKNLHDIIDSFSKVNQLQTTIEKFEIELDSIKNQTNKHDEYRIREETLMRRTKKLETEVASWKKRYEESQKAPVTTDTQSVKLTDFEKRSLVEIKDSVLHIVSKVAFCIKDVTTLIFDRFIFKDEKQSFGETSVKRDNDDTSTSKIDNKILRDMINIDQISDEVKKELSNLEDSNENFNEESPKTSPFLVSREELNKIDNRKCECELTEQLEDTNIDNKSIDVEQAKVTNKATHDVIETKEQKHDEIIEVDRASHYFSAPSSNVLKDYNNLKKNLIGHKEINSNSKSNASKLSEKESLDTKENLDTKIIFKSPKSRSLQSKSLKSPKSPKSLNSQSKSIKSLNFLNFNDIRDRMVNAEHSAQGHCVVAMFNNTCSVCDSANQIIADMEN